MATAEQERTVRFELPDPPSSEEEAIGAGPGSPRRPEPIEAGLAHPPRRFSPADLVALVVRPLAVFFGGTGLAWALVHRLGGRASPTITPVPIPGYGLWLAHLFPLPRPVGTALSSSLQLAVAGLLVGGVLALVLGGALRVRRLSPPATLIGRWLLALSPPVTALAGVYGLILRANTGLALGSDSIFSHPGPAVNRLVMPALVVGLAVGPSLATLVARPWAGLEPAGRPALASPLASRSAPHERWRIGFPAASLVAAMVSAELLGARGGLFALVVTAMTRFDVRIALDSMALIILLGAAVALVTDLVGLAARPRPGRAVDDQPVAPGASLRTRPRRPSERELRWRTGWLLVLAAVGLVGGVLGRHPKLNVDQILVGPLSGVHLLGTDQLGRDLGLLAAAGLGQALLGAAVAALEAVAVAYGLSLLQRNLRGVGQVVPGAVIDALWWPLPLMLVLAAPTVGRGLFSPPMISLLAVGLIPGALRLLRRERVGTDRGSRLRLVGVWLLVAPVAVTAALVAGLAGFDRPPALSLGSQLGAATASLRGDPWPAVIPGAVVVLLLVALYGLGSALVRLGWYRTLNESPAGAAGHDEIDLRNPDLGFDALDAIHDDGESENWVSSPILAPPPVADRPVAPPTPAPVPASLRPPVISTGPADDAPTPWARPDRPPTAPPSVLSDAADAFDPRVDEPADDTADAFDPRVVDTADADAYEAPADEPADSYEAGEHDGDGPETEPETGPDAEAEAGDSLWDGVEDQDPTHDPAEEVEWADSPADAPAEAPGGLAPNYSLQPGLPPVDLNSTMRLPVVRVRRADGDEPPADR